MRRALAIGAGVIGLAIAGCLGAGALLPAGHVAVATATVPAPPAEVWARITDFDRQESWRTTVADVRFDGGTVTEVDAWGEEQSFGLVERREGERLVLEVRGDGAFGGTWTIALAPEGGGTRVEITERGEIRSLPLRPIARLFFDPTETARTWLGDLGRSFGAEVEVSATRVR